MANTYKNQMNKHLQYPKLQTIANSNSLFKLCHEARTSKENIITFDLSKTTFITPFSIVLLAGTISEILDQGKRAKYKSPENSKTRKFLSGIGFNKFFKITDIIHKIESKNVQLKRLDIIDYSLTDQIIEVFKSQILMTRGVRYSLRLALNELMTNAFDHSQSKKGCYVCAQYYPSARHIRLCIADFGIGILKSLKKINKFKSLNNDYEGIKFAIKEGVTSRIDRTAGYGLSHIKRFIEVNKGKMYIISGNGKVLWDYNDRKIREQTMHSPFKGTIINLLINVDREGLYFLKTGEGDIF